MAYDWNEDLRKIKRTMNIISSYWLLILICFVSATAFVFSTVSLSWLFVIFTGEVPKLIYWIWNIFDAMVYIGVLLIWLKIYFWVVGRFVLPKIEEKIERRKQIAIEREERIIERVADKLHKKLNKKRRK